MDYLENEIGGDYEKLRDQIVQWNYDMGSSFQSEVEKAVDNAILALNRFGGSYQDAISGVNAALDGGGDGNGNVVGRTGYDEAAIRNAVTRMKANSREWTGATEARQKELADANVKIATEELPKYGITATRDKHGVWYLPDGRKLYEAYAGEYHSGGTVGTLRNDEVFAKLQKGEEVLTKDMADKLSAQIERVRLMQRFYEKNPNLQGGDFASELLKIGDVRAAQTENNRSVSIVFGDTIINEAAHDGISRHIQVTRDMMDQIARYLGLKL